MSTRTFREDVDTFGVSLVGGTTTITGGPSCSLNGDSELTNDFASRCRSGNAMNIWSYDAMYYPWGDSAFRPCFGDLGSVGRGSDYVTDDRSVAATKSSGRFIVIGFKYPIYPWLNRSL